MSMVSSGFMATSMRKGMVFPVSISHDLSCRESISAMPMSMLVIS